MSSSSVVPIRASGAGRFVDVLYPAPFGNLVNGSNTTVTRGGVSGTCSSFAGGTGTQNAFVLDGETIQLIRCFAAADLSGKGFANCFALDWRSLKGLNSERPYGCHRVVSVMGATGFPVDNTTRDMGLEMIRAGQGFILKDANDGIGIRIRDANNSELLVRGPNGVQRVIFAVNNAKLNKYDLRIIGATAALDAQLKLFVNDAQVVLPAAFSSWSAGTNLPSCNWVASRMNFEVQIVNFSGNAGDNSLCLKHVHMMSAPTEGDLL